MSPAVWKDDPVTVKYEARARNLIKGELKRRKMTYAQLAERLRTIGVVENERYLYNKIGRGAFSAAFLLQCLEAINGTELNL